MIEVAAPKTERVVEKISYDEFLRKYSGVHAEWIGGEVITLITASNRHQDLVDWLIAILRMFVETYNLGWIRSAPFNMQMPHLERGREPDILFVAQERLHIVQSSHLAEAADLVIEIVSPESIGRDRGEKFVEYEAAGVREYWLIDPDRQQAEFYRLTEAGRYHLIFPGDEGIFRSEVLSGFWLKTEWLWQEHLPKVLDTARELRLL
ncbi:MAG: Uma2 family endonuclease [Anaerolineales bacterium]|nr:Uma2 family endonuclease [Anaerolineales bacterium]